MRANTAQDAEFMPTVARQGDEPPTHSDARAFAAANKDVDAGDGAAPKAGHLPGPGELAAALELGWTLWNSQQVDAAGDAYRRALEIDPAHPGALAGLGRIARRLGHQAEALDYFQRALERRPDDPDLRAETARAMAQRGRLEEAVALVQGASETAGDAEPRQSPAERVRLLVDLAWWLWSLQRVEEADAAYRRAVAIDASHPGAWAGLGRIARRRGEGEAAVEYFRQAMERRPDDPHLRVESARAFAQFGRWEEAVELARPALEPVEEGATSGSSAERVRLLIDVAWWLWTLRRVDEAQEAYQRAAALDESHPGAWAGLGRIARFRGDSPAALEYFQRALKHRPEDPALLEAFADMLSQARRPEEAASIYAALLRERPNDARLLFALARSRRQQGDETAALGILRSAAGANPDAELRVSVAAALGDLNQFDEAEALLLGGLESAPDPASIWRRLGLLARRRGEEDAALGWFQKCAEAHPADPACLLDVAVSLYELRRIEESHALLAKIDMLPGASDERVKVRRFEHFCQSLQLDLALARLADFGPESQWPAHVVSLAAALYAARSEWDKVLALFAERVAPGRGAHLVAASPFLTSAVGRAARARGRQAEVLALFDGWAGATSPDAADFRDALAEELQLLHMLQPETPAPAFVPTSPVRAARSARLAAVLAAHRPVASGVVYLCTDLAYLPGAIVALSSVIRHNRAALRSCRFCVFLSEDALPVAVPLLARLSAAYGLNLEAIPAARLGRDHIGFRGEWGFFTAGARLSDAAYYRILAALWLGQAGRTGRALYLDCDVCVGPGLAEILTLDLAGRPLAARFEDRKWQAIRQAARRLDLHPDQIFNSGVLLLDLAHPATAPLLVEALNFARNEPERLSHADQCALNHAFAGQVTALPVVFNLEVRPKAVSSQPTADPVVTHYTMQPKPWDPAYPTRRGDLWVDEFCALAEVFAPEQMRDLMTLALVVKGTAALRKRPSGRPKRPRPP